MGNEAHVETRERVGSLGQQIAVTTFAGIEAGMKCVRNWHDLQCFDIHGQEAVEGFDHLLRAHAIRIIKVRFLSQSVHSGVCSAGSSDAGIGSFHPPQGPFHRGLDAATVMLLLPAVIASPVIAKSHQISGHYTAPANTIRVIRASPIRPEAGLASWYKEDQPWPRRAGWRSRLPLPDRLY